MSRLTSSARPALLLLAVVCAAPTSADEPLAVPSPCPDQGSSVTVIARKRELWLCRDGAALSRFQVAMGRGGFDKRRKGDGRTPLGTYTFGAPRSSAQFGVFIPFLYPTADQAAQGFSGGALGIHGPPRGLTEPEYPTTFIDWTDGCIATGTDADITAIAEFVRDARPLLDIR